MVRKKVGRSRQGFTLIEVLAALGIIGLAVVALLGSIASGTRTNQVARETTQAVFLAQELREWTLRLPFRDTDAADVDNPPGPDGTDPQVFVDDLDDLMNVTFSPPRDGTGSAIADMAGWSETITMTWRDPSDLTAEVTPGASGIIHVQVDIDHQNRRVLSMGWLVARKD